MPFNITPALSSELEKIHRFYLSIVLSDPLERFLFPHGASDITVTTFAAQDRVSMHDPQSVSRPVVVKDAQTGELVSYALWMFFTENEGVGKQGDEWLGGELPSDVNKEPLEALMEEEKKNREELMGGKPYAYLSDLATSPTHRRQGAASLLMEWGLSLADSHHLPAFLEASPASETFYLQHGFEVVSTRTIDLHPWGVSHTESISMMLRPAKPPLPPDTITISPWLTNADFASFPSIEDQAFHASHLNTLMFGPTSPSPADQASQAADHAQRTAELLAFNATDPTSHIIKAFLPATGEIIAYGAWHFYLSPTNSDPHIHPPITYPPDGNAALGAHFFGSLIRTQEHHMRAYPRYVFMRLLVVRPAYQGRGVGTRLLGWGLDKADGLGLRAWIDASPKGFELYRRLGWREVERLVIGMGEWGGEVGVQEVTVSMVRLPRGEVEGGDNGGDDGGDEGGSKR